SLLIVVDGRYRDIPVLPFAVPVFGTLGLAALAGTPRWGALFGAGMGARRALGLGAALALLAVANLIAEGLAITGRDFVKMHPTLAEQWPLVLGAMVANAQVLTWSAMLALLALPFLAQARQGRRTGQ
ncbi:MAG: exo-beta-1,3-glucanase, partial [Alphaproteobacteria bacterium]|nr:exo-beta-1,3-glucanase [Alphaproteobacteria bacterium]